MTKQKQQVVYLDNIKYEPTSSPAVYVPLGAVPPTEETEHWTKHPDVEFFSKCKVALFTPDGNHHAVMDNDVFTREFFEEFRVLIHMLKQSTNSSTTAEEEKK